MVMDSLAENPDVTKVRRRVEKYHSVPEARKNIVHMQILVSYIYDHVRYVNFP